MKKVFLFLIASFFSSTIFSQIKRDLTSGNITFSDSKNINLNKQDIKIHAATWIINNFSNYDEEILFNDEKKVISKGNFSGTLLNVLDRESHCDINYVMEISIKDNKYKTKFSSFKVVSTKYPFFASLIFKRDTNSIESYKNDLIEQSNLVTEKKKKKMLKVANDSEELEKYFYFDSIRDEHIIKQIKQNCKLITESFNNYMEEQMYDEW